MMGWDLGLPAEADEVDSMLDVGADGRRSAFIEPSLSTPNIRRRGRSGRPRHHQQHHHLRQRQP